ncbi:unnamed protein product, partial [Ixodes hexagonus]
YKNVDGLRVSNYRDEDVLRSALSYKPQPEDIFIVSYPKCGTTWTQYIVYYILNGGVPPKDFTDFLLRSPYLEVMGTEAASSMVRPGAIKTHLPFHKQPYSEHAKYIYITRNPYDCCVSFYHSFKGFPLHEHKDASFDPFFDVFVSGKVTYGDYFDHVLSWYAHRMDYNVLFITYENLKKDIKGWVLKIADFLGEEYGAKLRQEASLLNTVLRGTSFESVKKVANEGMLNFLPILLSLPPDKQLKSMQGYKILLHEKKRVVRQGDFIRKGVVGDYKNHFSCEQIRRLKERIEVKTAGTDVMNLWSDVDLP